MTRAHVLAGLRIIGMDEPGMPLSSPVDVEVDPGTRTIRAIRPHDRVPEGATDCRGRLALPGLVNAHDHLYSKELRRPLAGMDISAMRNTIDQRDEVATFATMVHNSRAEMAEGVLVVRDLGARHGLNARLAQTFESGVLSGPLVVPAGRPIVMTGGHVWTFGRETDGPVECRRAVREQRKAGAKVIKIMASGGLSNFPHEDYTVPEFTPDELEAIVDESHRLGLPTCAHAFGVDAVEAVIRAGVDSVEHGVHLDESTVDQMKVKGISYVPTMANMQRIASPELNDGSGNPERSRRFHEEIVVPQQASVSRAAAAGVRIGVGTDSTGTYQEELAALAAAGLDDEQLIRAATVDGAAICRVDGGVLEEGRRAAMVLYEEDPREDARRITNPAAVFDGRRIYDPAEGALA